MNNTALFILLGIVLAIGIFWLVGYSARRRQKYWEKTSIKPQGCHKEGRVG